MPTPEEILAAKKQLHEAIDNPRNSGFLMACLNPDGCQLAVIGKMSPRHVAEALGVLCSAAKANPMEVMQNHFEADQRAKKERKDEKEAPFPELERLIDLLTRRN